MAKAGYKASTEGAVALTAATAKTILNVIAPAQFGIDLVGFSVGFDGVTASAVPALVELVSSTQAGAGTAGTTPTVRQIYGRAITAGFTAGANYSAEPTVLTNIDEFLLTPNAGLLVVKFPLGQSPDQDVSRALGLRLTAPAAVNVRATAYFERC